MPTIPMQMLILALAGWLNEEQRVKIEFLEKQIRVLQELHGGSAINYVRSILAFGMVRSA